ncbi:ATP-binding protein [Streptomyces sp. NPDC006430]|uniref:ATP-binding protein n=1 Tax=Streptomyces sp. NPDC006430 TaxID=3154299 RepID=UPI00339DD925
MNHVTRCSPGEIDGSYRMDFTVSEHSARHVRRILRIYLTSWGLAGLAHAAELALTELVANVVRHVPGRACSVLILCRPEGLRVEVTDADPRPPHPVRGGDALAEDGRGLLLVEAVTDRWGCHPTSTGKTVWFEYDRPAGVPRPPVGEGGPGDGTPAAAPHPDPAWTATRR